MELNKLITFYKEREKYKKDLRRIIAKYGVANLSPVIQRTIPKDMKTLYELTWWMQPKVLWLLPITALKQAKNESIRKELNA